MGEKDENATVAKKDPEIKERETWGSRFDFLLACIGFSVGLGNVWRFPYLCYKNGGGIGLSTLIIVFFLYCYYNVILAWAFRYFFASFTKGDLLWKNCDLATFHCTKFDDPDPDNRCKYENNTLVGVLVNGSCLSNSSALTFNITPYDPSTKPSYQVEPVTEYWENKVLAILEGVDDMGSVKWVLVLCLLFAWIVVYACICKRKDMYVTATSLYIFVTVLLIRNCLLDGAGDGILYYIRPDFEKMKITQVWVDASTQIFSCYFISLKALTALRRYNKFHHNSYRDSVIFALANSGTSIFACFIIFSILGHMAKLQDKDIGDVAEAGPGLAFIAYPKALTLLPAAPFWSIMFFLMVILLGLDIQFVGVKGVVTAIVDQFPQYLRRGHRREMFIGCVCILQFLVGLPMVCPGGMYVFQLFDYYSGSRIILFVAAFMCVAVAWCYGVRRFYHNIMMMFGWRINLYMAIGWIITSTIFCMTIFVLSTIDYSELSNSLPNGTYVFQKWAVGIGWSMAAFAAIWIPIGWIYQIIRYGHDSEVGGVKAYCHFVPPVKSVSALVEEPPGPIDQIEHCYQHDGGLFSKIEVTDNIGQNRAPRRKLNDIQLTRIAEAIGVNFELLAPELNIEEAELDRIKLDNPTTIQKVLGMLKLWRQKKNNEATMYTLCEVFEKKRNVVTINYKIVEEMIS